MYKLIMDTSLIQNNSHVRRGHYEGRFQQQIIMGGKGIMARKIAMLFLTLMLAFSSFAAAGEVNPDKAQNPTFQ